jgi:hypothetical protein
MSAYLQQELGRRGEWEEEGRGRLEKINLDLTVMTREMIVS